MSEITVWTSVSGYAGTYEVNRSGEVRSWAGKPRILKPGTTAKGYHQVSLCVDGESSAFRVHRLVAMAFIPNPLEKPCVNHKNGIKHDNRVENLEWCTHAENTQHAYDTGLLKSGCESPSFQGAVQATPINDGPVLILCGRIQIEAAGFHQGNVSECIAGKRKTHKGYVFSRQTMGVAHV